jgi:hypothetical protein
MTTPRRTTAAASNLRAGDCKCKVVIFLVIAAAIFAVAATSAAAQSHRRFDPPAFVTSIQEATVDHTKRVTHTECILVLPDGRFHLESRKEVAPNPVSSLSIYESSLDSTQLQQLQDLLKEESIKKLSDYTTPTFPMSVPWFSTFSVKMARGGQSRSVGYWLWRGGTADAFPNSTPDNIKKTWKDSEIALRPFVKWFHWVQSLKLTPSDVQSTQCATDGSSDTQ